MERRNASWLVAERTDGSSTGLSENSSLLFLPDTTYPISKTSLEGGVQYPHVGISNKSLFGGQRKCVS